jgi:hypothetical protein
VLKSSKRRKNQFTDMKDSNPHISNLTEKSSLNFIATAGLDEHGKAG